LAQTGTFLYYCYSCGVTGVLLSQRKDAQREAREKERAMQLQELCEKERERRLAVEEKSKRAVTEWFRKKDRELKGIFFKTNKNVHFSIKKVSP